MNGISDNNNFGNAISIQSLVDSISDNKKFGFGTHDMNNIVNGLGNRMIVSMCVQYRYSSVILDAHICNYYGS